MNKSFTNLISKNKNNNIIKNNSSLLNQRKELTIDLAHQAPRKSFIDEKPSSNYNNFTSLYSEKINHARK